MANPRKDLELPCITEILKDGQWAGQPAFVIGGGPSLKGFDFERLRGKGRVLGANMAWKLPVCEVAYLKDSRLFNQERASKALGARDGQNVLLDEWGRSLSPFKGRERLFWVRKLQQTGIWGKSLETGILRQGRRNKNAGIELVNIIDCLGCSPIYLLGFDLNTPGGNYENWHQQYPKGWVPKCYGEAFREWIASWVEMKSQIRGEVINLNPNSSLDIFPKQRIEEVL